MFPIKTVPTLYCLGTCEFDGVKSVCLFHHSKNIHGSSQKHNFSCIKYFNDSKKEKKKGLNPSRNVFMRKKSL